MMKKFLRWNALLLALCCCLTAFALAEDEPVVITTSVDTLTVAVGRIVDYELSISPRSAKKGYTFTISDETVAEVLREKMLLNLRDEIPHGTAVTVERFKERGDKDIIDIDVNIYCEKKSHKGMIIGKGGQMLKKIASEARVECEEFLGARVNLQCWVKVREDWRDNDRLLDNLGFAKP